ncbi:MAG TPA: hemolysin family protein [Thermoleophilaceae bacterium]|nr:hemolysin family protein [Thermoleophilaceae bacterium]
MVLAIVAALALVAANGFFVATEFSITRLRPTQVGDFEKEGRPGASSVRHAADNIDAYLAACQLGITVSSLGLGALGEPAFEALLHPVLGDAAVFGGIALAFLLAFLLITTLHVVVGELSPKSLAIARTARVSLLVAPPMRVFYLVTKPLVDGFNGLGNLLLKPFGIPPAREAGHAPHSESEIRQLMRHSQAEGMIQREDLRLSENVFSFGDMRVREVMMPRPDIDYVTTDGDVAGAARRAMETGHTRFPLCEPDGGLDAVVGSIHVKDLLSVALKGEEVKLTELARAIGRFSESTLIDEVLREMQRRRQHMALVMDEHGTAVGLVTLEDILEELVGEIEDEFDPETVEHIRREGPDAVVDGSTPVRMLAQELGIEIADPHEATIGGHIVELLGRMPQVGEVIELDGYRAEVKSVADARITGLRFSPQPEQQT